MSWVPKLKQLAPAQSQVGVALVEEWLEALEVVAWLSLRDLVGLSLRLRDMGQRVNVNLVVQQPHVVTSQQVSDGRRRLRLLQ